MLEHLGLPEEAARVMRAIEATTAAGIVTPDLGGTGIDACGRGRGSGEPLIWRRTLWHHSTRNRAAYADVYVTAGVLRGASSARVGREEPRVRLAGKNACRARSGAAQ